jgi:dihydrodipicolinate synthase/N-acetylneuraminate lyase
VDVRSKLLQGGVIPAHPLALTAQRKLDERRQRALTRYYSAAGATGVAVGVHTTQFAIREVGLLKPVLELATDEIRRSREQNRELIAIAGACGGTAQALSEAELARSLSYDAVLLSLGAMRSASLEDLIEHCKAVAAVIPVIGFYLQPAVGGRVLPFEFWTSLAEISNVVAIKIAPFNRYQTLDVVRAVASVGRGSNIALYTGNDDNIVVDLLTKFNFGKSSVQIVGGLLGHWAVWTHSAVLMLRRIKEARDRDGVDTKLLTLAQQVTDMNAAIFDPGNNFRGCIAGINEVLRRQGLLLGRWCLDPEEDMSPGQSNEIDRVCRDYADLIHADDELIRHHLDQWLD